jgi:hypothetical protein
MKRVKQVRNKKRQVLQRRIVPVDDPEAWIQVEYMAPDQVYYFRMATDLMAKGPVNELIRERIIADVVSRGDPHVNDSYVMATAKFSDGSSQPHCLTAIRFDPVTEKVLELRVVP